MAGATTWSLRAGVLFVVPTTLAAQVAVGPTARVSAGLPHAAHTEAIIAADPANATRLAACSMAIDPGRNRLSSALYLSRDAGATWRLAVHDTTSRLGQSWDPTCGFAPQGTVLFATLPDQVDPLGPELRSMTRVYRSADGGATWGAPLETSYLDNEDVAVDWTGGAHHGRIYLVGVRTSRSVPGTRHLSLIYSSDGGRSFQGPVNAFPQPGTMQGHVGAPVVTRDGHVLVPVTVRRDRTSDTLNAGDMPEEVVAVVRVSNGGTEIGAPVTVAPFTSCGDAGPPVVAVDRSTGLFGGRTYVVFPDMSHGRCQVKLSWSDDGTRWSAPLPVDDPAVPLDTAVGPDAFLPQVAVNHRGVVGLTWYDRREDPRNREFRLRFTASVDGGRSVMRSVPVSQRAYRYASGAEPETLFPSAMRFGPDTSGAVWIGLTTGRSNRLYYQVGDYGGLAARADGAFQPIWIDNRTQVPQLYTAAVTVSVPVRTAEERDRQLGRLVSDSVFATISRTTFDAQTCTVQLGVELVNRSSRPVRLPLVVRVDEALSQLGEPLATGGARDEQGRPLWRVGSGASLAPRERASHTATFKLEHCRPLAGRGEYAYRERLDARLYGTPTARVAGPKILAVKLRVFEPVERESR